jgi:bifunctional non-homologous end joining protein LigD
MDKPRPVAKARAARTPSGDKLARYSARRDFAVSPEPPAAHAVPAAALSFVVQKHWATRLHYDFRLELDGVLLSWAVPKGPCFDPAEKRMAVHVEDHPVSYASFEGTIPPRQYGAGKVIVWDHGTWEPVGDPREGMRQGKLLFRLHGQKLAGLWELVRIAKPGDRQDPWMLFKKRDAWARPLSEYDVIAALPDSVVEKPLGLLEQRQPRGNGASATLPEARIGSAAELPGARKAPLPATLAPQLAMLSKVPPAGGEWVYELKFDGYRLLARIERGRARLLTRNGHDWTQKMPQLAIAVEALGLRTAWLDGEIVVLREDGSPDFNALQNAFDAGRTASIRYFLFDIPYAEGHDLRATPLYARRALLRQMLGDKDIEALSFSADFAADPASLLESARKLGMEGIMAKRSDAPYVSARSPTWLKLKATLRQEFVIGGFTDREGSPREVGSLILGVHDERGALMHAGSVGTGWDSKVALDLRKRLARLVTAESPFLASSERPSRWRRGSAAERWVTPTLVAEVGFAEWTPDGHVRHAVFHALRSDKPAASIVREAALPPWVAAPQDDKRVGRVKVSNPQRIIDPSTGLTKLDLVRYYESVADWIMPHLKSRPVSLVRGPNGLAGELFFQKHDDALSIPGLRSLDPALWPGHPAMLEVPTAEALVAAAQMNVIEFHTWNSTTRSIDKPDRMVFDLDPGDGVSWQRVQEGAMLTRTLLSELGLAAWLKTSGGKGLHVVVPLAPRMDYDTVKDFSQALVQHLARTLPSRFVAKSGAANRVGKIFVDYLRNGHGATTAAAFSARARPGLGVSVPVSWEQLSSLKSGDQWSIATAREHLSFQRDDPWADFWSARQLLAQAMRQFGYKPTPSRVT